MLITIILTIKMNAKRQVDARSNPGECPTEGVKSRKSRIVHQLIQLKNQHQKSQNQYQKSQIPFQIQPLNLIPHLLSLSQHQNPNQRRNQNLHQENQKKSQKAHTTLLKIPRKMSQVQGPSHRQRKRLSDEIQTTHSVHLLIRLIIFKDFNQFSYKFPYFSFNFRTKIK